MTPTAESSPVTAPARSSGGAWVAFGVMSAIRSGAFGLGGAAWFGAVDMLAAALLMGWLYRHRETALAIVATTPAWAMLVVVGEGGTLAEATWPAVVLTLWQAGLATWGNTVTTPRDRSRGSTTWTVWLLSSLVAAYIVGSSPSISPRPVSPMFVLEGDSDEFAVFSFAFAAFPIVAWLAWRGVFRLSTHLPQ